MQNVILTTEITGIQYGDFDACKDLLQEQQELKLIWEPSNKYDSFAIKIMHNEFRIGWIPAKVNRKLFLHIYQRIPLMCKIISLDIASKCVVVQVLTTQSLGLLKDIELANYNWK